MNRLDGKVAIITGCNSGIAYATVKAFLDEGAKVVGIDLNTNAAELFKENHEKDYIVIKGDVTDENVWETAVEEAIKNFGKVTTICNIAGISRTVELSDITKEDWLKSLSVNQYGTLLGMQMGAKYFKDGDGCSIINTGSVGGLHGDPYASGNDISYNGAKAGVRYMTRYGAWDLGKRGIRVNCICPGGVNTDILKQRSATMTKEELDQYLEFFRGLVCLPPYLCEPEDLANGYVYLASEESRCVTGIDLIIDCGWTAK